MEDPFIKTFWQETRQNKQLTWKGFLIGKEGFKEFLSEKYGINQDTPEFDVDQNDPKFRKMMDSCFYSSENKNVYAITHDAYHILLIQHLRENESVDELGFKTYFLTRDSSLNFAENKVCKDGGAYNTIHINIWLQMISPFLSPKMCSGEASNAYANLLGSLFPSLTKSIDPNVLIGIMGVWMEDPSIDTEALRRIIGSKYLKENFEKIHAVSKEKPSEMSEVIDPLLQTVIGQIQKKNQEKMADVERDYSNKISDIEEKINIIPQTPVHKPSFKYLLVIGFILLVVMIVCAFVSAIVATSIPDIIYAVLGTGGLTLIASYFFGEKALGKIKS